jgi:hypothetical protein
MYNIFQHIKCQLVDKYNANMESVDIYIMQHIYNANIESVNMHNIHMVNEKDEGDE